MITSWQEIGVAKYSDQKFWLTSHGGCGTNLFSFCVKTSYGAFDFRESFLNNHVRCHPPGPTKLWKKKYVYLFGDLINSIVSQERRQCLNRNSLMMKYGIVDWDQYNQPISYRTEWDWDDPLGIESQFNSFYNSDIQDILMLKYPFSKEAWDVINDFLGDALIGWPVTRPRRTNININDLKLGFSIVSPLLRKILLKYITLADYIDSLPDVIIK